jgi:adhesin transport system outer membrane protein
MVSFQELIALDNLKIKIHNEYLKQATKDEEENNEILNKILVSSKIKAIMDNHLEQEVNQQKAFSIYKKLTGDSLSGNICRPVIQNALIPSTLKEAIEIALRMNNKIQAQKEIIREQVSRLNVEDAKFRPDLKLQIEGSWDNDLALPENGQQDIYRIRLQSDWNLYNGGKDVITSQRERITVLEEKKILDAIKNDVIDKIKGSYTTFFKIKKRIKNLKEFIKDNQSIVDIYTSQLEGGERTYIDVLNAETELFRTKVLLIELEFSLFDEYYNILKSLNILSDSILREDNQICPKYVFIEPQRKSKKEEKSEEEIDSELTDELGL